MGTGADEVEEAEAEAEAATDMLGWKREGGRVWAVGWKWTRRGEYLAGGGDAKNEGLVANRPARKGSGQTAFGSEYAYMYLSIYRMHSQYRGV